MKSVALYYYHIFQCLIYFTMYFMILEINLILNLKPQPHHNWSNPIHSADIYLNSCITYTRDHCGELTKLKQCGPTNRIIDNSDFNLSEFEWQTPSNLKSNVKIGFRLNNDVNFQFWLKSMDFNLFLTTFV